MKSHEIDYKIFGDDIQFVEIELDPSETVIAEAGTMVCMEQGISFEVKMGDGLCFRRRRSLPRNNEGHRQGVKALAPMGRNSGKEGGALLGGLFER